MGLAMTAEAGRQGHTSTDRVRRSRQRRRLGYRCFTVDIHHEEIDALVRQGYLPADSRGDDDAILEAIYWFLERSLP
jgi:hypothetical protein